MEENKSLLKEEMEYEEVIYDSCTELEKAIMTFGELKAYHWNVEPTASKALKYGSSLEREKCSLDERVSWQFIADYKRIMWLIQVASDYCYSAFSELQDSLKSSL